MTQPTWVQRLASSPVLPAGDHNVSRGVVRSDATPLLSRIEARKEEQSCEACSELSYISCAECTALDPVLFSRHSCNHYLIVGEGEPWCEVCWLATK